MNDETASGEDVYFAKHDLREMFSRENVSRRRTSGHTLRRYLTDAQDRKILNTFQKLLEKYELTNNNDAVIAWVQEQVAAGAGEEIHADLLELAARVEIPAKVVA